MQSRVKIIDGNSKIVNRMRIASRAITYPKSNGQVISKRQSWGRRGGRDRK